MRCSWLQVHPAAQSMLALGFSQDEVTAAAVPTTCEVLSSFMHHDECLLVVDFDGGVVIDARLVQLHAS